jgi:hypothetical protein
MPLFLTGWVCVCEHNYSRYYRNLGYPFDNPPIKRDEEDEIHIANGFSNISKPGFLVNENYVKKVLLTSQTF